MPTRKYLDEVSYLDKEGRIHFLNEHGYGLLPDKNRQGEILSARSWRRRITDEIAGSVKAQLRGDIPVSPYFAYPAAGAVVSALSNPVTTIGAIAKSYLGTKAVNSVVDLLSDKNSWGELAGNFLDINPEVAELTNPGLGANALKVRKMLRGSKADKALNKVAKQYIDKGTIPKTPTENDIEVIDNINNQRTKTVSGTKPTKTVNTEDGVSTISYELDGNRIFGETTPETGNIAITEASFFNPVGSSNKLLQEVWKDLVSGDKITIANNSGALSSDSYPLFIANLRRVLRNSSSKEFNITPKGYTNLNNYGADRYKGFVIPTDGSNAYYKATREKLAKQIEALGKEYAKKYNTTNPFKYKPVLNPEYNIFGLGSWGVPAFEITKLKYGGSARRSLATGGSIHIKPSHRGRLTELKARTGKSEAELYNDGNPAHKKMVVFARNARKWKH